MDYKAVFFDFDYTLGDATEAIVAGFQYAFAKMGLPEPEREAVRRTIGMMLEDEYTVLTGDSGPENRARFRKLYTEKAGPLQVESTRLFPGAEELLTALHRQGIPAGIVSTKKTGTLRDVLEARGVAHLLTSIVGGDQVSAPKPDPQGLLASVNALDLAPAEVLFCGDTTIDTWPTPCGISSSGWASTESLYRTGGPAGAARFSAWDCEHCVKCGADALTFPGRALII